MQNRPEGFRPEQTGRKRIPAVPFAVHDMLISGAISD